MNIKQLMKQAQQMQDQMQRQMPRSASKAPPAAAWSRPRCPATRSCSRSPSTRKRSIPNDVEMLQDLVKAAVNEAARKVDEEMQSSMGAMTGGMKIPGF